MAHELWEQDKMAFRLQTGVPWHYGETGKDGRAIPIDHEGPITADMMRTASGHDWEVSLVDMHTHIAGEKSAWEKALDREIRHKHRLAVEAAEDTGGLAPLELDAEDRALRVQSILDGGTTLDDGRVVLTRTVPRQYAVVRSDTLDILGVVGDRYVPLQNRDAYRFLEAIMGQGQLDYETAGSLMGGRKVWVLAKLRQDLQPIEGVSLQPFVLLASSHDGSSSIRVRFTTVNVVCDNTLTAALNDRQVEFAVRHTAGATSERMVEEAQSVLSLADSAFARLNAEAAVLARLKMTEDDFSAFARVLVAPPKDDEEGDDELKGRARNIIEFLKYAWVNSPGVDAPKVAGTGWAALQAVTYYTTHAVTTRVSQARQHHSRRLGDQDLRSEAHLESVLFGSNERMARRAKSLLLGMAKEQGLVVEDEDR